ncbi:MAG: hypothetical protein VX463_09565, partial [Pseudomonadota bacterium]|nr:hypothetical protein [Pseudomonadota bacterium]
MRDDGHLGAGDPAAVEAAMGEGSGGGGDGGAAEAARLREAWARHGWRAARLDPLGLTAPERPAALDLPGPAPLRAALEAAYAGGL